MSETDLGFSCFCGTIFCLDANGKQGSLADLRKQSNALWQFSLALQPIAHTKLHHSSPRHLYVRLVFLILHGHLVKNSGGGTQGGITNDAAMPRIPQLVEAWLASPREGSATLATSELAPKCLFPEAAAS